MRIIGKELELLLHLSGQTGYANRSDVRLTIDNLGELTLPRDSWDISSLKDCTFKKIELSIPSGILHLEVSKTSLIDQDPSAPYLLFTGSFEWTGSIMGLKGGMSGYADFNPILDGAFVTEGLFCRHSVCSGQNWRSYCQEESIDDYLKIKSRHRDLFDLEAFGESLDPKYWESNIYEILNSTGGIPDHWKQWLNYLSSQIGE